MKNRLAALCAILMPATALAQEPDPNTPDPSQVPAPASTDVIVEAPPPAPAPAPVVIVNPPPEQPRRVVLEPQYETVYDSYNAPVFTTGALVFAASYGASVIAAASASDENRERGFERLYVPVAGPWLALNERGSCPITSASCDRETTTKVLLIADGVFQAAGVLAMIDGILEPSSRRVRVQNAKVDTKVRVTPATVGTGGSGVAVFGRF
ncbi:MAG: hypothetical protein JWP01_1045 [Myxococcales bacterium]|nr:hypothetical protein [Myxococcales bacterium]